MATRTAPKQRDPVQNATGQLELKRAARKSLFIYEHTFFLHSSSRVVPLHPGTTQAEADFCTAWCLWEKQGRPEDKSYHLHFGIWKMELAATFGRKDNEVWDALDGLMAKTLRKHLSLLDLRVAIWDYLDTLPRKNPQAE